MVKKVKVVEGFKLLLSSLSATLGLKPNDIEAILDPVGIAQVNNQRKEVDYWPGTEIWVSKEGVHITDDESEKRGELKYTRQKVRAVYNPVLTQRGKDAEFAYSPQELNGLNLEQMKRASRFSDALNKLAKACLGTDNMVLHTFVEVLVSSTGMFLFDNQGKLLVIKKNQYHIGRGSMEAVWGKPGGFWMPHQRLDDMRDYTLKIVKKFLGWVPSHDRLRRSGPDVTMVKPDYGMTYRMHNFGIIFAYVLQLTAEEKSDLENSMAQKGVEFRWIPIANLVQSLKEDIGYEGIQYSLEGEAPTLIEEYGYGFSEWDVNLPEAA